jgi:hypothetical protein
LEKTVRPARGSSVVFAFKDVAPTETTSSPTLDGPKKALASSLLSHFKRNGIIHDHNETAPRAGTA